MASARLLRPALRAVSGGLERRGAKNLGWYYRALERQEELAKVTRLPPFPVETLHGHKRANAFFDVRIGEGDEARRRKIVFELADDIVPRTVENFLTLCSRPKGEGFAGSSFHCIRKGFGIEGGDYLRGDGRGGRSAFATPLFADENFVGRHSVPGTISMCNSGVDSNSSIFFVSLAPQPHLDGRNVVFGHVVEGLEVIKEINSLFCVNFKPVIPVVIEKCGAGTK